LYEGPLAVGVGKRLGNDARTGRVTEGIQMTSKCFVSAMTFLACVSAPLSI
jgi:hypothetical protein